MESRTNWARAERRKISSPKKKEKCLSQINQLDNNSLHLNSLYNAHECWTGKFDRKPSGVKTKHSHERNRGSHE